MLLNIANLLLREKIINYEDINSILSDSNEIGIEEFHDSLVNSGKIDTDVFADLLKKNFNTSIENIKGVEVDQEILKLIRTKTAADNLVLPLRISDQKLVVAMANPTDLILIDELSFESGHDITPVISSTEILREEIIKKYKLDTNEHGTLADHAHNKESTDNILSRLKESEPYGTGSETEEAGINADTLTEPANDTYSGTDFGITAVNPFRSHVNKTVPVTHKAEEEIDIERSTVNGSSIAGETDTSDDYTANINTDIQINPFASPHNQDIKKEKSGYIDDGENPDNGSQNENPFVSANSPLDHNEFEVNPFSGNNVNEIQPESGTELHDSPENVKTDEVTKVHAIINILLVDQSKTTQHIISETFDNEQYSITVSDNAIDAMSKINKKMPDIIMIDVSLPHMDGYQLCRVIRKNAETSSIPVVILSGKEGIFDRMKGKIAGASEYVTKPFRPSDLAEIVKKLTII